MVATVYQLQATLAINHTKEKRTLKLSIFLTNVKYLTALCADETETVDFLSVKERRACLEAL